MIVFWAAISPVFGSAVASSVPVTLRPTTRTTKNATTPTSARVQVDAMQWFLLADRRPPPDRRNPSRGSVLRPDGRRQASDALDEAAQELLGIRFDRHVDVRRPAPDAAPVGHGLARGQ